MNFRDEQGPFTATIRLPVTGAKLYNAIERAIRVPGAPIRNARPVPYDDVDITREVAQLRVVHVLGRPRVGIAGDPGLGAGAKGSRIGAAGTGATGVAGARRRQLMFV